MATQTVDHYLAALPEDRKAIVGALLETVRANLDPAIRETIAYGAISWVVPHSVYPPGYHCNREQPLPFAGLASQKQYVSLYLMGVCWGCTEDDDTEFGRWFRAAWAASGKKPLDMGKACVRMKKLEDIPLDVIGEAIRRMPAKDYIANYERGLAQAAAAKAARKKAKA